jgi:hypothetical protein
MKLGIILSFALLVLVAIVGVSSYVSAANYGNASEQSLDAKVSDSQNILANYTTSIAEMVQVPEMYKKDLGDIIDKTFKGRYGDDGSKAMVQFIKEQNLNLDPSMYKNIQEKMEAGRNEFKDSQTALIDLKRSYKTSLGSVWEGFWLARAGYPKMDLNKIQPVINDHTDQAFKTHRDEGIKLNVN